jgi:2-oxoglutarate dehydrogenase complex dehydrogenase (E1) component-like enzyme
MAKLAELMSKSVTEQKASPELEKEYLKLTGELARTAPALANALGLEKSFVQKVVDILEDVYCLRMLVGMQDFQMNLLRERWNTVLIEINSASARVKR